MGVQIALSRLAGLACVLTDVDLHSWYTCQYSRPRRFQINFLQATLSCSVRFVLAGENKS